MGSVLQLERAREMARPGEPRDFLNRYFRYSLLLAQEIRERGGGGCLGELYSRNIPDDLVNQEIMTANNRLGDLRRMLQEELQIEKNPRRQREIQRALRELRDQPFDW